MAIPGQTNEISTADDNAQKSTSGDVTAQTFQSESPYQSKDGLTQLRNVADTTGQGAVVPEVSWATTVEKGDGLKVPLEGGDKTASPKEAIGNQITEMILANGDGPNRTFAQLQKSNPKLAAEIDKVAQALSEGKSPDELKEALRVMGELYKGFDPRPTDNRESKGALLQAKRDPAMVSGVLERTNEIMKMPPDQREKAIRKIQIDVRTFHLDGGNL